MSEMNELEKWVLETAKDINAKLNERAENWKDAMRQQDPKHNQWDILLETQEVRIKLIQAVMGK